MASMLDDRFRVNPSKDSSLLSDCLCTELSSRSLEQGLGARLLKSAFPRGIHLLS